MESAYLGKYGDDEVAACVQDTLKEIGIDDSHCRRYEGENGFALVTLKETDRVFLGSNKGGIAKEHDFGFTKEDLEYIKGFHLIYTILILKKNFLFYIRRAFRLHMIFLLVGQTSI